MSHPTARTASFLHEAGAVLRLLIGAYRAVCQRLHALGATDKSARPARRATVANETSSTSLARSSLSYCIAACRTCGRKLGAAFREALAAADRATANILYDLLRALERQLWVLDPRLAV